MKASADDIRGNKTKAKIVKNKLAPPFKTADFEIMYGKGISKNGCLIDVAVDYDVVKKGGSWYSYNDQKIGQGKEKAVDYLDSNPQVSDEIYEKVMELMKAGKK